MADVVLDYNQVIEETPVTGDSVPESGGLVTFQWKCDVNGACDLSNSFLLADIEVKSLVKKKKDTANNISGTELLESDRYIPDAYDFHAFPMLRCFQSITHIIDGQTVCNTQHPYADALIVEKFLTTHSKANTENFQALSLMKQIDNGMKEYNIFTFDKPAMMNQYDHAGGYIAYAYDWCKPGLFYERNRNTVASGQYPAVGDYYGSNQNVAQLKTANEVTTVLFQPPFDLWRLRQPFHGGIHQLQLNVKARTTQTQSGQIAPTANFGYYMATTCVGLTKKLPLVYDFFHGQPTVLDGTTPGMSMASMRLGDMPVDFYNGDRDVTAMTHFGGPSSMGLHVSGSPLGDLPLQNAMHQARNVHDLSVQIKRIRFLRRVIRTSVPPQLSNVQYNFTEIAMQHGTPTQTGMTQQFLLPSTTFGLIFYWRESTNTEFDQLGVHPRIRLVETTNTDVIEGSILSREAQSAGPTETYDTNTYQVANVEMDLKDFQFTYGGATYPMQRISKITGDRGTDTSNAFGYHRLLTVANQLQGVYNSTMDDFPQSYGHGYGKGVLNRIDPHMLFFPVSRTGNSDNGILQVEYGCDVRAPSTTLGTADTSKQVQLVVVALYDAQLNMQYSSNELQQIVLTQFK